MNPPPLDLTSCETEPIRTPGAIQPFGVLLAFDAHTLIARHASDNWQLLAAGRSPLGESCAALLGEAAEAELLRAASRPDSGDPFPLPVRLPGAWNGTAHYVGGLVVVDLEAVGETAPAAVGRISTVRAAMSRLSADALPSFCDQVAREVHALTGYDRVMVYRFDAQWNGQVIAEWKRADLEPFLGLHYPASDIPAQARALYLSNRIRVIPDIGYTPIPLTPSLDARTGRPVDLSRSLLRSVSPVHCEYLRNMGVAATMTASLIVDGRLWGLIACHHYTPKRLPPTERDACDLLAEVAAARLSQLLTAAAVAERDRLAAVAERIRERVRTTSPSIAALAKDDGDLLAVVGATGAVIWRAGRGVPFGATPPADAVQDLIAFVKGADKPTVVTDRLPEVFPPAAAYADVAAGMLALEVSAEADEYVLWFRAEILREVHWAGNPHAKPGHDGRLSPRRSFALWCETVRGRSRPWQPTEVDNARRLKDAVLSHSVLSQLNLEALLPICAWCKKVRGEPGYWRRVEDFIRDLVDVRFTHSICPPCSDRQAAEIAALRRLTPLAGPSPTEERGRMSPREAG